MSNILIIKHGSLGDIAQASGAIQDISDFHKDDKVYLLTSKPYIDLFKKNPCLEEIILDKRLSRFNLIYLFSLMRELKKYKFQKVFDLQNSSRSSFYKRILFPSADSTIWSSSETTLPKDQSKVEFDKKPVLDRFKHQLDTSGLTTNKTMSPDFKWACSNIDSIKKKFGLNKYIILFPFCSPHLQIKKWPNYNKLINLIKIKFKDELKKLYEELKAINAKLWDIEDNKRMCEKNSDFGENFIKLSRDVHFLNDDRAKIKLAINNQTGSKIKEIKQYTNY